MKYRRKISFKHRKGMVGQMAKNNENALLFEVGNIDQIVKSIEMLLEDDNMRIRLAHAGNSFIQDFSWDNSVKKFIEVIEGEQ